MLRRWAVTLLVSVRSETLSIGGELVTGVGGTSEVALHGVRRSSSDEAYGLQSTSARNYKGPKVRLFSFPRDVKRRAEWQRAVRRRDVDVGLLKDPKDLSVRVYFKYAPLVSDDVCIPCEIRDVRVLDNLLDDVERSIEKKAHQQEDKCIELADVYKEAACRTCRYSLLKGAVPQFATVNGYKYPLIPEHLPRLNVVEDRLVAPRLPFMILQRLTWYNEDNRGQHGSHTTSYLLTP
ncbi:hypothetical protein HPB47_002351 [Ixodes persulcatus]|uniref:Uncharacterized protein n=1 Tax=Ixodes persulcatus TaxID=34615 RepID=A0AC60PLF9_IXOPE|nr:hypothetical protein HPB47_002351 [Ixodes persulcatus]